MSVLPDATGGPSFLKPVLISPGKITFIWNGNPCDNPNTFLIMHHSSRESLIAELAISPAMVVANRCFGEEVYKGLTLLRPLVGDEKVTIVAEFGFWTGTDEKEAPTNISGCMEFVMNMLANNLIPEDPKFLGGSFAYGTKSHCGWGYTQITISIVNSNLTCPVDRAFRAFIGKHAQWLGEDGSSEEESNRDTDETTDEIAT